MFVGGSALDVCTFADDAWQYCNPILDCAIIFLCILHERF